VLTGDFLFAKLTAELLSEGCVVRIPVEMSVQGLRKLLHLFGVKIDNWGTGEALPVDRLLHEINIGESFLRIGNSGELERVLRVVKLIIEDRDRGILLEDYQILPDGRRKDRGQTPGGKIGLNETIAEAMEREMHEELGLSRSQYHAIIDKLPKTEEKPSKSYPGLRSTYELYRAYIRLDPAVSISNGYSTIDKEDGKKLFFRWRGQ